MARGPVSISSRREPYSIRRRVKGSPVFNPLKKAEISDDDEPVVIEDDEPQKTEVQAPPKGKGKGKKAKPVVPTGVVLPTEPEPPIEAPAANTASAPVGDDIEAPSATTGSAK